MKKEASQVVIHRENENTLSGDSLCYTEAARRMTEVRPQTSHALIQESKEAQGL